MTRQDAREVAQTTALLTRRAESIEASTAGPTFRGRPVEDALTLHRIAGSLHRYSERECNEDLHCRRCGGEGKVPAGTMVSRSDVHWSNKVGLPQDTCRQCEGTGTTIGKRVRNLEAKAQAIATAYGFRLYVQGDPRGCPLYLIPEDVVPVAERLGEYVYTNDGPDILDPTLSSTRATLQRRWINANYSGRGVPVVWLG